MVKKRPALFLLVSLAPLTHAVGFVYLVALTPFALVKRWWAVVAIVWTVASIWLPIMLFVQTSDVANGFWLGLTGFDTLKYFVTWLGKM
ncbi:MAG TPA: hypothetical protein PLZ51_28395, partial [Aggregatilineales bacterium]|nr:hypothetical protein [Aggregatilineales bacterium]